MTKTNAERRAEWLRERRHGIGASDAPAILGLSPWKSPLSLFTDKLGLSDGEAEQEMTDYQKWGLRLEDAIAIGFGEETGRHVEKHIDPYRIERHKDLTFMQATLDRRQTLTDGCEMPSAWDANVGDYGILELKNTSFLKAEEWQEEAPLMYQVQLQHQLFVTGATWGSLAVLIGGNRFRYVDMQRNDRFIHNVLIPKCADFWRHVQDGTPPPVDGHRSTRDALHRMFPQEIDATIIDLPVDVESLVQERIAIKAQQDELQGKLDAVENALKAAMGEHPIGTTPNGYTVKWKVEPKASYVVAASNPRVLRTSQPKKGKR